MNSILKETIEICNEIVAAPELARSILPRLEACASDIDKDSMSIEERRIIEDELLDALAFYCDDESIRRSEASFKLHSTDDMVRVVNEVLLKLEKISH